jgi:hypothetical protein
MAKILSSPGHLPPVPPMITFTDKGIQRKTQQAKITGRVSEMENI